MNKLQKLGQSVLSSPWQSRIPMRFIISAATTKCATSNIVKLICKELSKLESLIAYVTDRKGHDMRYTVDPTKIYNELGRLPETKFADGLHKTIRWYLNNRELWENIISGEYQNYYRKLSGNR